MGKRAVYPGMFDPMHNGHLDLIERSLRIFDELIVAVVANPSKEPLFTVKERLELIDECTTGIGMGRMRITSFDGPSSTWWSARARTVSCAASGRFPTSSTSSRWR